MLLNSPFIGRVDPQCDNCVIIFKRNKEFFCLANYKYSISCNKNIINIYSEFNEGSLFKLFENPKMQEMDLFTYFYKEDESLKELIYFISDIKHKDYFGNYFTPDIIVFTQKNGTGLAPTGNNFLEDFIKYICEFLMGKLGIGKCNNITEVYSKIEREFESENYRCPLFTEKKIYNYLKKILEIKNDLESFFIQNTFKNNKTTHVINTNKISKNIDKYFFILSDLPEECFDIDFIDSRKNLEYSSLSQGEKEVLDIRFKIVNELNKSSKINNLILFDEPTNSFHPQWQKNFLKYLVDVFSDKNIHFIITSHSPFILSDLPKENIIFLEKGKQVYPFDDGKQTFGSNIHTLLSHGFFMKDGLMGKFAKEKINDVYRFLTDEESNIKTKEEAQNIISLIGEPLIQKQIEDIYNRKFQIKSKDEIIQELQNKIAELEKKSK